MAQPVDSVRNCFQLSDCAIKKAISYLTESNNNILKYEMRFNTPCLINKPDLV